MAQLAISAAGAAVGFVVGGPIGAQAGWAVGSLIGSQFGPKQKSQGPRLEDLRVTGAEYGQPIPWAAGHPRLAGQVWWASDRREVATTTSQGKGGGGAESTSYTYEVDILYGLVDREILYVARIWLNGKLIWTADVASDADSQSNSRNNPPWDRLTVYTGSSTQLPDPAYEAVVGAGNAPAYRGRGSVFIEGMQLGNSGVIPNLTFEVVIDGVLTFLDKGFLSQFEVLTDATHVEATLGPDVVLTDSEAVDTGTKKFGSGSVYIDSGIVNTPTTITLDIDYKSWRSEGWFYITTDTGRVVMLDNNVTSGRIELSVDTRGAAVAPVRINFQTLLISGGGLPTDFPVSFTGKLPPKNQWFHWSIQYNKTTGYVIFHVNGYYWGRIAGGPGIYFAGNAFNRVTFGGSSGNGYVDSTIYRYFDDDESNLLYPATDIAVPTEAFEPPPYAYVTVEAYNDTLQNVVEDLCAEAGMDASTYDANALASITKPVRAFALSQVATIRSALEVLMSAYFFEAYVTDKIYFVPRAGSVADDIDVDDMGAGIDAATSDLLPTQITSKIELPPQVAVSYANVDADYTTATEQSDRLI